MVRVLHIFHNMGNGGIESFVMNYYRFIDKKKVQFDFLTSVDEEGYFDEEIRSLGGRVFHAYPFKKNPIRNYQDIARIVRENSYQIVHRHTGSAFGYYDLRAAKSGGATTLILHSHASSAGKQVLHRFSKIFLKIDCIKYACSKDAADFLFGNDVKDVSIINNAINAEKFRFSAKERERIRGQFGLTDEIVLGHVGAFYAVKNHSFIVDIFSELAKKNDKYVLWFVGDGELRNQIEVKVKSLGLEEKVCFWGNRNDVSNLLQAMDLFILPSFHEGFNIAAIEAQCAGLQCLVASQCAGLPCFTFIPLDAGVTCWAQKIMEVGISKDRDKGYEVIKQAQFDIHDAAKELERKYLSYAGE